MPKKSLARCPVLYSTVLEVRLPPTTYTMSPDTSYFNKGFIFITLHILFYFITSSTSCMPLAVGRARPSLDDDMGVLLPTLPPSNALPPINKCQFIVFDKELALVSPPAVDVDVRLLNYGDRKSRKVSHLISLLTVWSRK